jgi:hypothetical protein
MNAHYSGTSSVSGNVTGFADAARFSVTGASSGTVTTTSTPVYRYRRTSSFQACKDFGLAKTLARIAWSVLVRFAHEVDRNVYLGRAALKRG